MATSDAIGVGFVGAGFITNTFHAETLRSIRHAHASGVMNPTRSKAEAVATKLVDIGCGEPSVYGDVRVLDEVPNVDAVWITSPNHTRVPTIEAIAEEVTQGKADLEGIAIEKPLARTVSEAKRVVDLVEQIGCNHAYLENQVFMPGVERMKSLLWDGVEEDRPYLARSAEEHSGPHSSWFWDGEKQGGGVLNDMMCHSHKVNRYLLAEPDDPGGLTPIAVSGDISTLKWGREEYAAELADEYGVDYTATPAEDYARATVFYETSDGELVVGEATNSWCFVGEGLRITAELLGPEYSGSLNTLESGTTIFFSSDAGDETGYVVEKQEASEGSLSVVPAEATTYGYVDQNRHVVDAFRHGENGREDLYDGLEVVELCMASYKAAEEGRRIDLDTVDLQDYVPEPARGAFDAGVEGLE